ncbi:hypothetical protein SADUNF_Sadunf16G0284100 [Salix dunnii]|uniref:Uncharacterized protein n=1 Tax=Salix dunnii TaxID=1413687 RepID=A0A835JC86_9ROSI|nr:hypothetical protein SADUNF_Sadunf16G0284100 [Salix dunnii]
MGTITKCRRLKEETTNIASQSDYNQIRINDFARADHLTRLLRLVKFPSPFLFLRQDYDKYSV